MKRVAAVVACALLGLGLHSVRADEQAVAVQVHVSVQEVPPKEAAPADLPVRAVAVWYGKGKVEPRTVELTPSRPATLSLPPGRWVLTAEAAGFWGSEHPIEVMTEAADVGLVLWPAGQPGGRRISSA